MIYEYKIFQNYPQAVKHLNDEKVKKGDIIKFEQQGHLIMLIYVK